MTETKRFTINGKYFSFDILETYKLQGEYEGDICYFAKCHQNGKYALIDTYNGVQFEGEERIIAEPCEPVSCGGLYTMWGGELRIRHNWQKTPVKYRY